MHAARFDEKDAEGFICITKRSSGTEICAMFRAARISTIKYPVCPLCATLPIAHGNLIPSIHFFADTRSIKRKKRNPFTAILSLIIQDEALY